MTENRQKYVEEVYEKLNKKLSAERDAMGNRIPYIPVNGKYPDLGEDAINWWTNGFWAGIMWQMYRCGEEKYRQRQPELRKGWKKRLPIMTFWTMM